MKAFPFRVLFVSLFLPPVCYMFTLHFLEGYFRKTEIAYLNRILIQNTDAVYGGQHTIQEEIANNLREYFSRSFKHRIGFRMRVIVSTRGGHVLYPAYYRKNLDGLGEIDEFSTLPDESANYVDIAAENYKLLNEGLILAVDLKINHNSWLSNGILVFFVFLSAFFLRVSIRKGIKETDRREAELERQRQNLLDRLRESESSLQELKGQEENHLSKLIELRKDKSVLTRDVDDLVEEIEALEKILEDQRTLKEETEHKVDTLTEELEGLKRKYQRPGKRKKKNETVKKRFKTLYKNLIITDRAIDGFLSLTDEFQLKAEEVIHRLNDDDSLITVKRRVFGKGGKSDILEAEFLYSGRIYFKKESNQIVRVVSVGTKNTQEKDLLYLEKLK